MAHCHDRPAARRTILNSQRWLLATATLLIGACTYNEYNTYNELRATDAGVPGIGGASGASGLSSAGRGGADVEQAGAAGVSGAGGSAEQGGDAGSASVVTSECTGCVRLTITPNAIRDLNLELPTRADLSQSQLTWRVRMRGITGDVPLSFYAQSGDDPEDRFLLTSVGLNSALDWQWVGVDLSNVPDFAPPSVSDSGVAGGAGSGFDMGFPFDKARVNRVGLLIQPYAPGIFTPFTVEIDSVAFSDHAALDVSFASNDGGLRLVEGEGASLAGASLQHIAE